MKNNVIQGGVPVLTGIGGLNADNVPVLPEGGYIQRGVRTAEARAMCRLDPTKEYEPIKYAYYMNGIGFAPTGDLIAVTAQKKQGKTQYETVLMTAALRGEYMGVSCTISDARILFYDTEQHPRNTAEVYRRVCYMAGIDGRQYHERLNVLCTRGYTPDEQVEMLMDEIAEYRPHLVFIDGIRDLCNDFNDPKASTELITKLMRVSLENDCAIFNVLHTNYGTDKMRGHLGTELGNKAADVFACKKGHDEGNATFTITQEATRNADIEVLRFTMQVVVATDGRMLAIPAPLSILTSTQEQIELDKMFCSILANGQLKYGDLQCAVMEQQGIKKTAASEKIKAAKENGIIAQDPVMHKYRYLGLRPTDNADKRE